MTSVEQPLSIDLISRRQSNLKAGDLLFLGDMSNLRHIFKPTDHAKHSKVKQFLGSSYLFLDGSPAYIERFECHCCEDGEHNYLAAITNGGKFVGHVCRWCSDLKKVTENALIGYRDVTFERINR